MSIWIPIDLYVGLSFSRSRLLEVPTYTCERLRSGYKAVRLELACLIHLHLIIDLKRCSLLTQRA